MKDRYVCKIASLEEMNRKWDDEIQRHVLDRANWILWKEEALQNAEIGNSIPYYGLLNGEIVCEETAMINPEAVQNSAGLVGDRTVYLCAFRTVKHLQGKGFFSALLRFMLNDLKNRGFEKATLGVETADEKSRKMYAHFGFTDYIKSAKEIFPDGTGIDVDYYSKSL